MDQLWEKEVEPVKSNGFLTGLGSVVRDASNKKECCVVSPPPMPLTKEEGYFVLF